MFRKIIVMVVILLPVTLNAQHVGQKTNVAYWATGTPNVAVEVALGNKFTIDLEAGYNPWDYPGGTSTRHWVVRPGGRYWFCRSFQGHFLGLDVMCTEYDAGNIPFIPDIKEHAFRGKAYGPSISYGYHFPIGKRWGIELTAALGYLRVDYSKYVCHGCAEVLGTYRRTYWGPTKLGVTFVFMLR